MKKHKGVLIIAEDPQILVVSKPAGMPIQSTDENSESLVKLMSEYTGHKLFITHRIDQVVTGICLFAKQKKSCDLINQQFREGQFKKKYYAVVNTDIAKDEDRYTLSLFHDTKLHKAFVNDHKGKKASLHYKKIGWGDNYDVLEIDIQSGRFHQIRCMLAAKGLPIKGDVKYGARRSNPDRSIHLHAYSISFMHPYLQKIVHFSAPLPSENLWQYFFSNFIEEIKK